MPHAIPDYIELKGKFNKPVQTGKPRKITADGRDKSAWKTADATETLDKPIQIYRQWYRFLQLAIELEKNNVTLITREERVNYPKPKRDVYGHMRKSYLKPVKHKIKINWSKYKQWGHPELIENSEFNVWWKQHREIFFSSSAELVSLKSLKANSTKEDANFQYIKFDTRKRVNDTVGEIRQLLSNQKRKPTSTSAYPVYGVPNMRTLQNRYNALLIKLTTKKTDEEVLSMNYFRSTQITMKGYKVSGANFGRVMRDLIQPAKQTLLAVCDGYFVKNPNKDYL